MPFCPVCREAYITGVEICADCNAPLVKKLPPLDKEKIEIKEIEIEEEEIYDTPAFLCSLTKNFKIDLLIGALKEQGIPAYKKWRGLSQYLSIVGMNWLNEDDMEIYVPSRFLDKAKEILTVII